MNQVTIVIPTFNRSEKIRETLAALSKQDFLDFSVIIVDDGSTDNTEEVIAQAKNNFPLRINYQKQQNAGASSATNNGVRNALDGLIILLDDDILPEKSTIRKHIEFHKAYPDSILSGSADTDPSRSVTDVQRYKLFMELEWKKLRPDTTERIAIDFNNFIITTANISFPKNIFISMDGFNTALRDGYDVDFGFRALQKNILLFFDSNVKAIHNDQISLRYYAKRQRAYIDSKRTIFTNFPELRKKINLDFELQPTAFKSFFYKILRQSLMVRFFESKTFSKIVPRSIRYRIYGSTIASLTLNG